MNHLIHNRLTDFEMWANFRSGNDLMFSMIYYKYAGKIYQFGLKFTSNISIIEDAIHDVFIDILINRKTIGQTDNILFYLMKSFKRKLFRLIKKEKRYKISIDHFYEYPFEITYSSIEHEMINNEELNYKIRLISNTLKLLTPRQKEAIYLRFYFGFKYNEISELMNINIEACRNLINRSIKALKNAVREKVVKSDTKRLPLSYTKLAIHSRLR